MNYKSMDFVSFFSLVMGAIAMLGQVAVTFGPWAPAPPTARLVLTFGWLAFWMIGIIARSASALLAEQADQIAVLQRQLGEQRPTV